MSTPQQPEPSPWAPPPPNEPAGATPTPPSSGPVYDYPETAAVDPPPVAAPGGTPIKDAPEAPAEAPQKPEPVRRDHKSLVLIAVIVVAVALASVLGIELYARHRAASDVNAATSCLIDDGSTVSFGGGPLVLQYLGGHIDKVTIRTNGKQIRQAKQMAVAVTARDITLQKNGDSKGTIGQLDVSVVWPTAGIADSLRGQSPLVSGVTTSASTNEITLSSMFGDATVKPVIEDGVVKLQSTKVTTFIGGIPREIIQPVLDLVANGIVGKYPMGLKAQDVKVTDDGLQVDLSSTDQPMLPSSEPCLKNLSY